MLSRVLICCFVADIARRLAILLTPEAGLPGLSAAVQLQRYDPQFVLEQYETLADMCIAQRAAQQADVVLEAAEVAGLQPSQAMLAKLTAALRGQPRRSEVGCCGGPDDQLQPTLHAQPSLDQRTYVIHSFHFQSLCEYVHSHCGVADLAWDLQPVCCLNE